MPRIERFDFSLFCNERYIHGKEVRMELYESGTLEQEVLLNNCFDCLVDMGLESATMRSLCEATGLTASSIYYRFANKDELVMEATVWGFRSVARSICWSLLEKTETFQELFDGIYQEVSKNKKQLKLIYQVAGSPKYGAILRNRAKGLDTVYAGFTARLAEKIGCDADALLPYVRLFVATVREYVLWDDEALAEKNLQFLYSRALELRGENK